MECYRLVCKARRESTYPAELADAAQELGELVKSYLRRLQQRYAYFSEWKLREEHQEDYERRLGEGYLWALYAGDTWIEVVLDADFNQYVDEGLFVPRLTVRAQVHETPTWGSLLMQRPLDRREQTLVICPVFNSDRCKEELYDTLLQVSEGIFMGRALRAASVEAAPSAYKPTHNIQPEDIHRNPTYWNIYWAGSDYELQKKVKEINAEYFKTHTYIPGETDCNDMAIDIWNMLRTAGVTSVIVIGNLDKTGESFADCDHAWLLVFNREGRAFALEPTSGKCHFEHDIGKRTELKHYWEGFFYKQPSDLRADIKERW